MNELRNDKDKKCGNLNNNRRIERGNFGTFYPLINPRASTKIVLNGDISDFTNFNWQPSKFLDKPQELRRKPQNIGRHVFRDCLLVATTIFQEFCRSPLTNLLSLLSSNPLAFLDLTATPITKTNKTGATLNSSKFPHRFPSKRPPLKIVVVPIFPIWTWFSSNYPGGSHLSTLDHLHKDRLHKQSI